MNLTHKHLFTGLGGSLGCMVHSQTQRGGRGAGGGGGWMDKIMDGWTEREQWGEDMDVEMWIRESEREEMCV